MYKLLIIDDDKDICLVLSKFLLKNNYAVDVAYKGEEGLQLLRASQYAVILCDYRLPDHTGVEMLRKIKLLQPGVAVIIITGYSDVRTAVETFRYGASDYVTKPLYPDELLVTIKETIAKNEKRNVEASTEEKIKVKKGSSEVSNYIVGKSIQSQTVQKYIELIAPSEMSVIIHGETGTGKEFVAQSIHQVSKRADKPFIAIDCGALPKELAGSELFGHVKGAFTGAVNDKPGSFEIADGGTIFLDEIGNLSYENQKGVKEGRFREDLFHRLNEFKIQLSPLRERKDDIVIFANYFLEKANQSLHKNVKSFAPDVIDQITNYYWHGNLRELHNVVKRSVLLTTGDIVQADSLPQEIIQANTSAMTVGALIEDNVGLLKSIAGSAERQAIIEILEKVNYNKSKAAELLKIDRKTLYNKLKLYSINA